MSQVCCPTLHPHFDFCNVLYRFRPLGHVDRLDRSPRPPDDFQGCTPHLVCTSDLENRSSQLGNESNETYKEDQPGIQRVEGAAS
jgi:hypothetical protein